ncbi:MAG: hypothetical protein ACAH80_04085 [Alphaproteobacteria bacterium]
MDWFRAYHGMPYDPLLTVVAKRAGVSRAAALALLVTLMDYASRNVPRGSLEGLDPEPVAAALDLDPATLELLLDSFRGKSLITKVNTLFGWEQLQPAPNDRLRRHRAGQYRKRRRKKNPATKAPRFGKPHGGDEARAEAMQMLRARANPASDSRKDMP